MKLLHLRYLLLTCILYFAPATTFAQRKHPVKKHAPTSSNEDNLIKNGIKLNNIGFKISEAHLFFDDESLVPEDNKVELNQNVNMLIIIDSGWTEIDGRVFPGSKQVIKVGNGNEISNSGDLFAAFDITGVSSEDARYMTLNSVMTDPKNKKNYVIVQFKVWDKKGPAEITGSYKLYIK